MTDTLLDPTAELGSADRIPLELPSSLEGLTVGLLDISKTKGDVFLDRVESQLNAQGVKTLRFKKPTFTRPAPAELIQDIATQCDVVVEALAD